MTLKVHTVVYEDWTKVYIDGKLALEGHSVRAVDVFEVLKALGAVSEHTTEYVESDDE